MTIRKQASAFTAVLLAALTSSACGDNPFQVIEETDFAASLGVDLAVMEERGSGVYILDRVVGEGAEVVVGSTLTIDYAGFLADGTSFDEGTFSFTVGGGGDVSAIAGMDDGVRGMRVGGERLLVIPPALGYAEQGNGIIPPGAILVFEVTATEVVAPQ